MRFFVALAFACGTLATAVLPLGTAAEAHDILSSESDIQRAGFDIETAPDMAVAEYVPGKALGSSSIFKSCSSARRRYYSLGQKTTLLIRPHI